MDNEATKSTSGANPRASRAGTRSVATLNEGQLARKRANDREAQRAIRQRRREHIERLEKRIKELSSEGPSDDPDFDLAFKEAQRRNVELEQELAWLRKAPESKDGTSSFQQQPPSEHQVQQVQQPPLPYQAQEHQIPTPHFSQHQPQHQQQHSFQRAPFLHQIQQSQVAPQYFPPQEQEHQFQQH
ncbi:hypothetical protein B0J14DRAFT_166812 [Halenospora varia]|nr:hypothetical protein B0J14DRAFT_166812 [Halenospora varia]